MCYDELLQNDHFLPFQKYSRVVSCVYMRKRVPIPTYRRILTPLLQRFFEQFRLTSQCFFSSFFKKKPHHYLWRFYKFLSIYYISRLLKNCCMRKRVKHLTPIEVNTTPPRVVIKYLLVIHINKKQTKMVHRNTCVACQYAN